jgi:FkbM family methyltransferase
MRSSVRRAGAAVLSRVPSFRGKGRITLLIDRLLTNTSDPASYIAYGHLNGGRPFIFDLRAWGPKFAFYYREWEKDHVQALRRLYRGGTFLDIGSSIGLYPVSLGREVEKLGGSIISIEPVPLNRERQLSNLRMAGCEALVTIIAVALGSAPGELRMWTDPAGADNNAFMTKHGDTTVPVRRLDDVMRDRDWPDITLIKMDVEGYEPEIIAGGRETITRTRPTLFAEFNRERMQINGFSMDEAWSFLMSCGYACYRLASQRFERLHEPSSVENLYFIPTTLGDPNTARASGA